jgi:peptidoglycan pentaglycine glycine transferase (the first glycine)
MVGVPKPENLNEDDSLWGVYRFKAGFGGEIANFLGCLDLPIKSVRAAACYRFEPIYYRLYQKLKHEVFYKKPPAGSRRLFFWFYRPYL